MDDYQIEEGMLPLLFEEQINIHEGLINDEILEPLLHPEPLEPQIHKINLLKSIILGLGTGLATMPIFNHELKELDVIGIDLHDNDVAFAISTVNSAVFVSVMSGSNIYKYLNHLEHPEDLTEIQKFLLSGSKYIALAFAFS